MGPLYHHWMRGLKMSSLQPTTKKRKSKCMIFYFCFAFQRTIRIFLPSVKFIVDGQRDTFLETTFRVICPTDNITFQLIWRKLKFEAVKINYRIEERTWSRKAMSKSSDTLDSDQIFLT